MSKIKAYQAGGMRKVERFNVDEARRVTAFLRSIDFFVISPWEMDEELHGDFWDMWPEMPPEVNIHDCLRRDYQALTGCDAIVLMDGWAESDGAQRELRVAEDIGLIRYRVTKCEDGHYDLIPIPHGVEVYGNLDPLTPEILLPGFHDTGEITVVDPKTGGAKGSKPCRTDLLPQDALLELANHYGRGAQKYEDRNWELGYAWHLSYASLLRHLFAWWGGAELDEDGFPHITAAAWHAVALLTFSLRDLGTDDRPIRA